MDNYFLTKIFYWNKRNGRIPGIFLCLEDFARYIVCTPLLSSSNLIEIPWFSLQYLGKIRVNKFEKFKKFRKFQETYCTKIEAAWMCTLKHWLLNIGRCRYFFMKSSIIFGYLFLEYFRSIWTFTLPWQRSYLCPQLRHNIWKAIHHVSLLRLLLGLQWFVSMNKSRLL